MNVDTNDTIRIFCENIKKLRAKEKLSKKEMAKKLGISTTSLTQIENGKLPPRLNTQTLFFIHGRFGILPKEIFTENFIATLDAKREEFSN